jgi:hypothetical protein
VFPKMVYHCSIAPARDAHASHSGAYARATRANSGGRGCARVGSLVGGPSMHPSKQMKSAKLEIALQLTEVIPSGVAGRRWEVHDVERNRGFRVTAPAAVLGVAQAEERSASESDIEKDVEGAIGLAIERALVTPPEKIAGTLYDVIVASEDVREHIRIRKTRA